MGRCELPEGVSVRPDGVHEVESVCVYELVEVFHNVTVEVWKCPRCGHVDVVWKRQEDTVELMEGGI